MSTNSVPSSVCTFSRYVLGSMAALYRVLSFHVFPPQSARDIALVPASVSTTVHDYVHGLAYSRCATSFRPLLIFPYFDVLSFSGYAFMSITFFSPTAFRFRSMKQQTLLHHMIERAVNTCGPTCFAYSYCATAAARPFG
jgi:hypothetical protein